MGEQRRCPTPRFGKCRQHILSSMRWLKYVKTEVELLLSE